MGGMGRMGGHLGEGGLMLQGREAWLPATTDMYVPFTPGINLRLELKVDTELSSFKNNCFVECLNNGMIHDF